MDDNNNNNIIMLTPCTSESIKPNYSRKRGPTKKADIHNFFDFKDGSSHCKNCTYNVKGCFVTTLKNHLKKYHIKFFEQLDDCKEKSKIETTADAPKITRYIKATKESVNEKLAFFAGYYLF